MTDDTSWTRSLPQDIQMTLASFGAVAVVDIMAVLRRERLLRKAVACLSWSEVIASGIGLRNNSFGAEPEIAIDLMQRPRAGLLFVGGFFTDLGVPGILRHPELAEIDEYKRRIAVIRILVDAINAGSVAETTWEFAANGWLLTRARDRLAEFGPDWALNPLIVNPVIENARRVLDAQEQQSGKADRPPQTADLIDYRARHENRMPAQPDARPGRVNALMRTLVSRT